MYAQRLALVFIAVLFPAGRACAQINPCLARTVPVNVTNERGTAISGLTADNFKGSVHHKPIKIISVTPDDAPHRVLIVLDASGSMTGEIRKWQLYVSVANNLVASMPTGTSVGLSVFSSKIERHIPFTLDRHELEIELKSLQTGPKAFGKGPHQTALWDSLATEVSEFSSPLNGDSIYLISDGGDNASRTQSSELKKILVAKAIRVFAFSPDLVAGPTPEEQARGLNLIALVEATGGTIVPAARNAVGEPIPIMDERGRPTAQQELLLTQFRQIFRFQRLEIEMPRETSNVSDLKLEIRGLSARDLVLTFPHQLASCAAVVPKAQAAP